MGRKTPLTIIACLSAMLAASVARAETPPPEPASADEEQRALQAKYMKAMFGDEAPKHRVRGCFVRLYDAAHLKAHPYQKVVEMRVSVHYNPVVKPATENSIEGSHWGYSIRTRLRDSKGKTFLDDGSCRGVALSKDDYGGPAFKIRCDAACDAGDDLYVDPGGKKALLRNHFDLVHPELDGPGADPKQQAKLDDSIFRVYLGKDADCAFDKP